MVTITKEDLECPEELEQLPDETREQYRKRLEASCIFPGDAASVQLCVLEIEDMHEAEFLKSLEEFLGERK